MPKAFGELFTFVFFCLISTFSADFLTQLLFENFVNSCTGFQRSRMKIISKLSIVGIKDTNFLINQNFTNLYRS